MQNEARGTILDNNFRHVLPPVGLFYDDTYWL